MIEAESQSPGNLISTLYVDDEQDFLALGKLFLERTGTFSVGTMTSAREALESYHIRSYDVIISDYMMPGMDGIAFLKEVRKRFGDIPFILFTGRGHEKVVIEAINNGADFYIQKDGDPWLRFVELSDKIQQIVKKKRSEQVFPDPEKHLFDIIDFIPDATFAIDQSGKVTAWNRAIEEMTGISFRDIMGKDNSEYSVPFYGHHRPLLIDLIDEPVNKIEKFYSNVHWTGNSLIAETDFSSPGGYRISALVKVCRHFNADGEVIGAIELIQDITKMKKTEQDLRKIEERFHGLAKSSYNRIYNLNNTRRLLTDAMDVANLVNWEYDVIEDVFTFDDRFYAMYGTTAEREGGNRMTAEIYAREFIHPRDRNYVAKEVKKAFRTTDPNYVSILEHRIIRRDGEVRYIIVHFGILKDSEGRTIKTYGANQDITDRKKTELALRRSQERLHAVTMNAGSWIWEVDSQGIYRYSSPLVEQILGYKPDELVGKAHYYDLFDTSVRDEIKAVAMEAFNLQLPFRNFKNTNRHRDGSRVILLTSGIPVFDENGAFSGYYGVDQDITKENEAEEKLVESEARYRMLADNVQDIIWTTDEKMELTYISPSVIKLRGYTPKEVLEKPVSDSMTPESFQLVTEYYRQLVNAIQNGTPIQENLAIELELYRKDGSTFWAELMVTAIFDASKKFVGIMGVTRDVNVKKLTEKALRKANRQLSILSSITRHDILNNISVIYVYLELVEQKLKNPELLEHLRVMMGATKEIQSQIEFTRVYEKIGSLEPQWVPLNSIMPFSSIPDSVTLTADVPDINIFADPMVQKVFFTLLDNSIRHGLWVTEIRVSVHESDNDLTVVWEDNGIGIIREEKEKIFERGYGNHTGLGIFLVREILSLTDISITETGMPGSGARFEIRIPKWAFKRQDNNT